MNLPIAGVAFLSLTYIKIPLNAGPLIVKFTDIISVTDNVLGMFGMYDVHDDLNEYLFPSKMSWFGAIGEAFKAATTFVISQLGYG